MNKIVVLTSLICGLLGSTCVSQESSLAKALLEEKNHCFDDLPVEVQYDIGSLILHDHPAASSLREKSFSAYMNLRPLQLLQGHARRVRSTSFSLDATQVLTASDDHTAKIWDTATGRCMHTLQGHAAPVTIVRFSAWGDRAVTASDDLTAKIWDVTSGACLCTFFGHPSRINEVLFNSSGDKILTASRYDYMVRMWDTQTGTCLQDFSGHTDWISCFEFNHSGDKIITGSEDGTVRIWDVQSGHCLQVFQMRVKRVNFSYLGDTVVAVGSSNEITIRWDILTGTLLSHLNFDEVFYSTEPMRQLKSSCGKFLVADDTTVKIFDIQEYWKLSRFLECEATYKQALLILALYELSLCRKIVNTYGMRSFENQSHTVPQDQITFDLNKYPHLQREYMRMPESIKKFLDPFVRT